MERYALDHFLSALIGRNILFIGSEQLDRQYYSEHYPVIPFVAYDAVYFASVIRYNQLQLSKAFYIAYVGYEFMLILQTYAIVLKDDLDYWCTQSFDYVGALWPDGYELFVNLGRFEGEYGNKVRVFVGNDGLSLR
jgi:CDP-diglyceride synthetase